MEVTTIGLDIAKNVFQVHGVDQAGEVVIRKRLRRSRVVSFFEKQPGRLVGIEACPTAHYWAREVQAIGHEVRLMPASYVKPYVKRNKNYAADAEAICEAVTRPTMRFVGVKMTEQPEFKQAGDAGPSHHKSHARNAPTRLHLRRRHVARQPGGEARLQVLSRSSPAGGPSHSHRANLHNIAQNLENSGTLRRYGVAQDRQQSLQ